MVIARGTKCEEEKQLASTRPVCSGRVSAGVDFGITLHSYVGSTSYLLHIRARNDQLMNLLMRIKENSSSSSAKPWSKYQGFPFETLYTCGSSRCVSAAAAASSSSAGISVRPGSEHALICTEQIDQIGPRSKIRTHDFTRVPPFARARAGAARVSLPMEKFRVVRVCMISARKYAGYFSAFQLL